MNSSNKRIAFNTILNSFRMTLTIFVPLIIFPYTSRIFGADGTGRVEWVKSTINVFILIAQLGIYTYAVREGVKIRDNRLLFSKFAQELLIINGIASVVSYTALHLCIMLVPVFSQNRTLLLIYSINIIMTSLGLDWVYGVYEEYKYITLRQIAVQLFSLICIFVFVRDSENIITYMIISTISLSGANIFNIIRSRKYISYTPQKNYGIKKHIKPVFIFFASKTAANAYNYIDNIMLGLFSSERAVGLYSAGVKINTILITFFAAMGPVYLPKLVDCVQKDNVHEFNSFLRKVVRIKLMLALPMAIGMAVMSAPIIEIIAGEDFSGASVTLKILSVVLILIVISNIIQNDILIPLGKEKTVLKISSIGAVINICINSVLIYFFADKGAAAGSIVAELAALAVGFNELRKIKQAVLHGILKEIKKYIISSAIMGIFCAVMLNFIEGNVVRSALIIIPAAVIIYFGILFILNDEIVKMTIGYILRKLQGKTNRGV